MKLPKFCASGEKQWKHGSQEQGPKAEARYPAHTHSTPNSKRDASMLPARQSRREGMRFLDLAVGECQLGNVLIRRIPPANILYETILSPQLDSGCFTQEGLVCSIKMSISQRPRLSLQAVSTLRRFSRAAHTAILGNPVPDELSPRLEIQSRWTSHCRTSFPAKQKYQAVIRAS